MKTKYVIYQVSGIVGVEGNGQVLYPVVNGIFSKESDAISKVQEIIKDREKYTILKVYEN